MKETLLLFAVLVLNPDLWAQKAFVVGLDNMQIHCLFTTNTVPYFLAEIGANRAIGPASSVQFHRTSLSHKCTNDSDSPTGVAVSHNGTLVLATSRRPLALNGIVAVNRPPLAPCRPIEVGEEPWGIAISPDGSKAYVANSMDGTLSIIDLSRIDDWCNNPQTADLKLDPPISVGLQPRGVTVSPDGSTVFVTNNLSHNMTVIDVRRNGFHVLGTYAVGDYPSGVDVSSDGLLAYTANAGSNTISVVDVASIRANPAADPITGSIQLVTGAGPQGIRVSPQDPRKIYVANAGNNTVAEVDLNNPNPVRYTSPRSGIRITGGIDIAPDGSFLVLPAEGAAPAKVVGVRMAGTFGFLGEANLNVGGTDLKSASAFGRFVSGHGTARMDTLDRLYDTSSAMGFPTCCIDEECLFVSSASTPTFSPEVNDKLVRLIVRPRQGALGHISGRIDPVQGMVFKHWEDVRFFQVRLDYGKNLGPNGEMVNDFIDLDLRQYDGILLKFGRDHSLPLGVTVMVFTDAAGSAPVANSLGKSVAATASEARFDFQDFMQGNNPLDHNDLEHSRIITVLMNASTLITGQLALESVILYDNP
ncbi:YncE family protein [bacterium]|nr:YncE family protein [bacterium]